MAFDFGSITQTRVVVASDCVSEKDKEGVELNFLPFPAELILFILESTLKNEYILSNRDILNLQATCHYFNKSIRFRKFRLINIETEFCPFPRPESPFQLGKKPSFFASIKRVFKRKDPQDVIVNATSPVRPRIKRVMLDFNQHIHKTLEAMKDFTPPFIFTFGSAIDHRRHGKKIKGFDATIYRYPGTDSIKFHASFRDKFIRDNKEPTLTQLYYCEPTQEELMVNPGLRDLRTALEPSIDLVMAAIKTQFEGCTDAIILDCAAIWKDFMARKIDPSVFVPDINRLILTYIPEYNFQASDSAINNTSSSSSSSSSISSSSSSHHY